MKDQDRTNGQASDLGDTAPVAQPRPGGPLDREAERRRLVEEARKEAAPILDELAAIGIQVTGVSDLFNKGIDYRHAIPLLLDWLPRIRSSGLKEGVVRALSVRWAKPHAAPALVDVYRQSEDFYIKWAAANGLEVVADDSVFEDIAELVQRKSDGRAREMLAMAMGKMKDPRAEGILLKLLDDEDVAGHAIKGLRKVGTRRSLPHLQRFLEDDRRRVRNATKAAIRRIEARGK